MFRVLLVAFAILAYGECQCNDPTYAYISGGCFKAYYYYNTSWEHAQELCQLDDANLATITSCTLLGDLARYFHLTGFESTAGYWISAKSDDSGDNWKWMDSSMVEMGVPFWGTTQTNETWEPEPDRASISCAQLSPSDQYYFHDEDCEQSGNPLCQLP